jgi:hypothetical protein
MLSQLQAGPQHFTFSAYEGYLSRLRFYLGRRGTARAPEATFLWEGGPFDADYDGLHPPREIPIPADATRVQLVALLSGHGFGADAANCAEFCNHTHVFTVNGVEHLKEHPLAGGTMGCLDRVGQGITPNQYGTWPYGRGGWCPGMDVAPWVVDVTDEVQPGEVATLSYRAGVDGQPYDQWLENEGKALADMGWRQAFIPIPRNMIDETVAISIQNWNRNDNWLNTWSQVTDIRVWEPYQLFLPSLTGGGMTAAALNQDEMQVLRNQQSSFTVKSR